MDGERSPSVAHTREEQIARLLCEHAPLMAVVAAASCSSGYLDPVNCAWYHGVWPYLRVLGVVSSPAWHRDFYGKALRQVIELRPSTGLRVLISGAADFSMLEQVLFSAHEARCPDGELGVTVLDRCQTPLESCQWYAEQANAEVTLRRAELFDRRQLSGPFDVIVTDAFLTRFDREHCARVIRRWHELLRPDAVVVTTIRLHDDSDALRDFERDVTTFVERVRSLAQAHSSPIFRTTGRLVQAAETYARRMHSADVGDEDDVVDHFSSSGFDVVSRERACVTGELYPVNYLRIVARKRVLAPARV